MFCVFSKVCLSRPQATVKKSSKTGLEDFKEDKRARKSFVVKSHWQENPLICLFECGFVYFGRKPNGMEEIFKFMVSLPAARQRIRQVFHENILDTMTQTPLA